jgi:hypothetical protein
MRRAESGYYLRMRNQPLFCFSNYLNVRSFTPEDLPPSTLGGCGGSERASPRQCYSTYGNRQAGHICLVSQSAPVSLQLRGFYTHPNGDARRPLGDGHKSLENGTTEHRRAPTSARRGHGRSGVRTTGARPVELPLAATHRWRCFSRTRGGSERSRATAREATWPDPNVCSRGMATRSSAAERKAPEQSSSTPTIGGASSASHSNRPESARTAWRASSA